MRLSTPASTRRLRRMLLAAAAIPAVLAASVGLTSCSSSGTAGEKNSSSDTLTLATTNDIAGWDPTKAIGAGTVVWLEQAVYEGLVKCDATGKVTPDLAESYSANSDNTAFTFKLRSDATFSDGTKVDAAAVKTAVEHLQTGGSTKDRLGAVTVTTPDDATVVMKTPESDPVLLTWLCQSYIASPKYLASGNLDQAPVGSGPYTLEKSGTTAGSVYTFERRSDYWDKKSFPHKKLVVKVISDATAVVNALRSGQIDAAPLQTSTISQAKSAGMDLVDLSGSWAGLIIADRQGKDTPALGNVDVRRAMNMVFDRQQIAKSLYKGYATTTGQIFRKGSDAWVSGVDDTYPYDISAAKKLMAKAGYADGFTVEVPFVAGYGWDAEMPMVIEQLKQINITVKQVTLSGPNAISDLISGKYGLIFWPLGNGGNSYQDITGTIASTGTWNVKHQADPKVEALVKKSLSATGAESKELQQEINKYAIDQAWFAPIVYPGNYTAFNKEKTSVDKSTDINGLNPNLRDFS